MELCKDFDGLADMALTLLRAVHGRKRRGFGVRKIGPDRDEAARASRVGQLSVVNAAGIIAQEYISLSTCILKLIRLERTAEVTEAYSPPLAASGASGDIAYFGKPQWTHFAGRTSQLNQVLSLSSAFAPPQNTIPQRGHFQFISRWLVATLAMAHATKIIAD